MADQALPENVSTEDLVELLIDGARYDDAEDVQTALDARADVNGTDYSGRTGGHAQQSAFFLSFFIYGMLRL